MCRFMVGFIALLLSACATGNLTAIHKRTGMGPAERNAQGIFIDAKQRAILAARAEDGRLVTCAEPSPDALTAIAAEAGVSLADASRTFRSEIGTSETAASIGIRTQTIQILRDGYFRLCEAKMNGLSEVQYTMMLRRFQTQMIALLAIEQLTGTVRGGDALVSTAAGSGLDMKEIYLHQAALASAQVQRYGTDIAALQTERSDLDQIDRDCEQGKTEGERLCEATMKALRRGQKRDLQDEIESLEVRKADAEATRVRSDELAKAASVSSASRGGGVLLSSLPARGSGASMADAVTRITMAMINQDYGTQMCFDYLKEKDLQDEITRLCAKVTQVYVEQLMSGIEARKGSNLLLGKVFETIIDTPKVRSEAEWGAITALINALESQSGEPAWPLNAMADPYPTPVVRE